MLPGAFAEVSPAFYLSVSKLTPMKRLALFSSLLTLTLIAAGWMSSAPTTWAERLGFPKGKKVIILHADDIGMCHEANLAAADYLKKDAIQSAAIMMPCAFAAEAIDWSKKHADEDIGLHLTLTSEWENYRWGSVADAKTVPTLFDSEGKLWHEVPDVVIHASAADVEKEIRAQIEKSIAMGYRPDHIDTHMGTLYGHINYMKAFVKVAEEYHIPANVIDVSDPEVLAGFRQKGYPITDEAVKVFESYTMPKLDNFTSVPTGPTYEAKLENFKALIRGLKPGLTEIIFHPSVQTENLKTITHSWQQRVWEAQMFNDPALQQFFKDEGIVFTNWVEIMKRYKK